MNIADIIAIIIIALGGLIGFKRGAIKGIIKLVGLVAITIISYKLKDVLANFLIDKLPFFNFGGTVDKLYTLNFLVYKAIAFLLVFIILYCILNIILNITGILDTLVKITVILEIPSKIIGAIIGLIEGVIIVFVASFALLNVSYTQKYIAEGKITSMIVEKTPIINNVFKKPITAGKKIYNIITDYNKNKDSEAANIEIIKTLINYELVSIEDIQSNIANGKLRLDGVVVAG